MAKVTQEPSNTAQSPEAANAAQGTIGDAPSREQLLYLLHEAAEIEHNLMCCYLYAAFSIKREDSAWSPEERAATIRWRQSIVSVALEEMTHLCLVANLMMALGAHGNFTRPMFPIEAGPYPAGFVIRLQGFSLATIEHFEFLERPHGAQLADGSGFTPQRSYARLPPQIKRLSPSARDYDTVGDLYAFLQQGLRAFATQHGEDVLFCGNLKRQVSLQHAPLPGVSTVTDLASAERAIQTIVTQGEGAGAESQDSHFCRFRRIHNELVASLESNPSFEPAWPVATNPVMNPPLHAHADRVHINRDGVRNWLDIGNAMYTTALRCLLQGFASAVSTDKSVWLQTSFALMRGLNPVAEGLAARSATANDGAPHAGLTFTMLRTLASLPEDDAPGFVAERLGELIRAAEELPVAPVAGEKAGSWTETIALMRREQARLLDGFPSAREMQNKRTLHATTNTNTPPERIAGPLPSAAATLAPTSTSASPMAVAPTPQVTSAPSKVERAVGKHLTVVFEGKRCIHSRHCVLDTPSVFLANTPGEWIYPDTVSTEAVIEVAHRCPSGAIRYECDSAKEVAPPVNTLQIRENGPYAVRADVRVAGDNSRFRVTLCRCGQSQNKPFCDGAHVTAKFRASGEPDTTAPDPLSVRNGPLTVTPIKNGPLQVDGNLEMCAGTGRTVARVTTARLCRCGNSKQKPFCDLSHVAAGFQADGAS
jgi:CDGSH-type Zn-finger protein/uncharacterized Fe-S cluster protein YjdI